MACSFGECFGSVNASMLSGERSITVARMYTSCFYLVAMAHTR